MLLVSLYFIEAHQLVTNTSDMPKAGSKVSLLVTRSLVLECRCYDWVENYALFTKRQQVEIQK